MIETDSQHPKKSINFISGMALGTAVAAGAAFLYKTKKGKKVRKLLKNHYAEAQTFINQLVKDVKQQAKKLESTLEANSDEIESKSKTVKKKLSRQLKKTAASARHVFFKSGKPLVK